MSKDDAQPELPPQAALYHLATGHYFSHAICLAAKLGIADSLADGPKRSEALAEATGGHAPWLRRVMLAHGRGRKRARKAIADSGHVIHDWDDGSAARILKNCRRAMPENGRLLTVEGI